MQMSVLLRKIIVLFFPILFFAIGTVGFFAYSGLFGVEKFSYVSILFLFPILYFGQQIIRVARIPKVLFPDWVSTLTTSIPVTGGENPVEEILDEVKNSSVAIGARKTRYPNELRD